MKQANPGIYLKAYLEWVRIHYIVWSGGLTKRTSGKLFLATTGDPTLNQLATVAAPAKQTCNECKEFNTCGSNAHVHRQVCRDCGNVTRTRMNTRQVRPRFDLEPPQGNKKWPKPSECPHTNIIEEHNSRAAKRSYCSDCNSFWIERTVSDSPRTRA